MSASAASDKPRGLALLFGWRRVRFVLLVTVPLGLLIGAGWKSGLPSAMARVVGLGFVAMLAFGLFEQWPKRLPRWLARWALQVLGVAAAMPLATYFIYVFSTVPGGPSFWRVGDRLV